MYCRYQEYNLKDTDLDFCSSGEFTLQRERPTGKEDIMNDPRSTMIDIYKENNGSKGVWPPKNQGFKAEARPEATTLPG